MPANRARPDAATRTGTHTACAAAPLCINALQPSGLTLNHRLTLPPDQRELAHLCVLDSMTADGQGERRSAAPVTVTEASASTLLSELLWQVYASVSAAGIGEFEHTFLTLLRRYVPFDSAWTGRSTFVSVWPLLHNSCLDRLPPSFLEDWLAVRHCDPVALRGNERLGRAMAVSMDDPKMSSALRGFCVRHGLAHVLNVACRPGHDGLITFVSLYRNDPRQPFTAPEMRLLEEVMRHFDQALNFNRSQHLARCRPGAAGWAAVCDHWGLLHHAGEGFRARLRSEWPEWQGAWLPPGLVAHLQRQPRAPYLGQHVRVDVTEVAGLLLIDVAQRTPADLLSSRERDVLRHYAGGLTYKEVARVMTIAPATVRHHLRNVHRKLGVSNKGQLLRVVQGAL